MKCISVCRISALWIVLALAGTSSMARAGAAYQGAAYQGAAYQGAAYQGAAYQGAAYQSSKLRDGWLEGAQLFGTLVLPVTKHSEVIAVTDFRGDVVVAVVWDPVAATQRKIAMHPRELVGLTWWGGVCTQGHGCAPVTYRVVDVLRDDIKNTMPSHSSNDDVWLYQVEYLDHEAGPRAWINACDVAPTMSASKASAARGLFVTGRWRTDGSWTPDGYTFSCLGGVIAKCLRAWGYKPWKSLFASGLGPVSLQPLHLACVRAARADYCGDGLSHTRDGTLIDIADRYGFNVHEDIGSFRDEAAFGLDGATWVEAPRWPTGKRLDDRWLFSTCTRPMTVPSTRPMLFVRSATLGAQK